jgi:hypothetical protein
MLIVTPREINAPTKLKFPTGSVTEPPSPAALEAPVKAAPLPDAEFKEENP